MTRPFTPISRLVLLAAVATATAACDRVAPTTGPVALRDVEHLHEYLVGAPRWSLRGGDGIAQFWSFTPDGSFRAWMIPGDGDPSLGEIIGVPSVPAEATLIRGTWDATKTALDLTRVRTETGAAVPDVTVALRWLDGKLRIGIGGHQYMRDRRPPAGSGP